MLDFESTGTVAGFPDEPWQLGLVTVRCGRVDIASCFECLLRIGDRPFHPRAPGSAERRAAARAAPDTLREAWPRIAPRIVGKPLAAHNAGTEKKFLRAAAPLHALGPWIDTLRLARVAYPRLTAYTLEDLLAALDLQDLVAQHCPRRQAHDALYDAIACAVLLEHLLALPGWGMSSLQGLARARPGRYHEYRRQAAAGLPPR